MTFERWLAEADRVLVAAGAGLSAAAGYDYTDTRRFAEQRVWSPQGDYGRYQCDEPCTRETWASKPIIDAALAGYDAESGETEGIPRCPRCGGPVFLNVHKGPEYVDDYYVPAGRSLQEWLSGDGRLLVIEIGAGYSTPTVIRRPVEALVRGTPGARLVRINRDHADVPGDLNALAIRADVAEVLA